MALFQRSDRGLYFEYSRHQSREEAQEAIETYYADGRIIESDGVHIEIERPSRMRPFKVMFPA